MYDLATGAIKFVNLYGIGIIGRAENVSSPTTLARYFYVKDHLGSIRQTLNTSKTVVAARDYYPYGETLRGYNSGLSNEKYKYNEKELDAETGLFYYGARYFDPVTGIWGQVDPLWEKYHGWSSYNYCLNDPVNSIDPNGEYTVKGSGISLTFKRWTIAGARSQLNVEQWGPYGTYELCKRINEADASFMPPAPSLKDSYIKWILRKGIDGTFAGPLLNIALDITELNPQIPGRDYFKLKVDQITFENLAFSKEGKVFYEEDDGFHSNLKVNKRYWKFIREAFNSAEETDEYFKELVRKEREKVYNELLDKEGTTVK